MARLQSPPAGPWVLHPHSSATAPLVAPLPAGGKGSRQPVLGPTPAMGPGRSSSGTEALNCPSWPSVGRESGNRIDGDPCSQHSILLPQTHSCPQPPPPGEGLSRWSGTPSSSQDSVGLLGGSSEITRGNAIVPETLSTPVWLQHLPPQFAIHRCPHQGFPLAQLQLAMQARTKSLRAQGFSLQPPTFLSKL